MSEHRTSQEQGQGHASSISMDGWPEISRISEGLSADSEMLTSGNGATMSVGALRQLFFEAEGDGQQQTGFFPGRKSAWPSPNRLSPFSQQQQPQQQRTPRQRTPGSYREPTPTVVSPPTPPPKATTTGPDVAALISAMQQQQKQQTDQQQQQLDTLREQQAQQQAQHLQMMSMLSQMTKSKSPEGPTEAQPTPNQVHQQLADSMALLADGLARMNQHGERQSYSDSSNSTTTNINLSALEPMAEELARSRRAQAKTAASAGPNSVFEPEEEALPDEWPRYTWPANDPDAAELRRAVRSMAKWRLRLKEKDSIPLFVACLRDNMIGLSRFASVEEASELQLLRSLPSFRSSSVAGHRICELALLGDADFRVALMPRLKLARVAPSSADREEVQRWISGTSAIPIADELVPVRKTSAVRKTHKVTKPDAREQGSGTGRGSRGTGRAGACYKCGEIGHKAAACPGF